MDLNRSTSSTSYGHVTPGYNQDISSISFVVTGPTSLVRTSVCSESPSSPCDKRHSTDGPVSPQPKVLLTVTSPPSIIDASDVIHGAVSDSEVGKKKSSKAATVGHGTGKRLALRLASKENKRDSTDSINSDTSSVNSTPTHRTLRVSDSVSVDTKSLFRKKFTSSKRPTRRISCKDLGNGQCQGWLMKKKEAKGLTASKWSPRWCVLHNKSLYYYKTVEWDVAEGVIYLPGFLISPAPEIKHRKFAFKAHHPGMTFFFATERQDDMAKWMNKLSLAALNFDQDAVNKTVSLLKPDLRQVKSASHLDLRRAVEESEKQTTPYYSESDDTQDSQPPSQTPSCNASTEDLTDLYRNIRHADLDLAGTNVMNRRSTIFMTDSFRGESSLSNNDHDRLTRKLLSLKRTLKDKEQRLSVIDQFLQLTDPVTSDILRQFTEQHPHIAPIADLSADLTVSSVDTSLRSSSADENSSPEESQVQMRRPRKK